MTFYFTIFSQISLHPPSCAMIASYQFNSCLLGFTFLTFLFFSSFLSAIWQSVLGFHRFVSMIGVVWRMRA